MKKDFEKYFEDTLFSEEDIEYVKEKVKEYLKFLELNESFLQRQTDIIEFEEYIYKLCNKEIRQLFRNYEKAFLKNIDEQNCLAYYIGMKKGFELGNLTK